MKVKFGRMRSKAARGGRLTPLVAAYAAHLMAPSRTKIFYLYRQKYRQACRVIQGKVVELYFHMVSFMLYKVTIWLILTQRVDSGSAKF